jgi:hypothetical protein
LEAGRLGSLGLVRRARLWPVALLAAATAAGPPGAGAAEHATLAARMVLDAPDFPEGATLVSEGPSRDAALPRVPTRSVYTRSLRNVRWGSAHLLAVRSSAEAAKAQQDALSAMSPLARVASSPSGRQAVLDEVRRRLGAGSSVTSVSIARTRRLVLDSGDTGVEVVLRMRTSASSFLVGETWVNVRNAISFTYWVAREPGLSESQGLGFARSIERRMRAVLEPAPRSTAPPAISGDAAVAETLAATEGRWTPAGATYAYRWLRCKPRSGCAPIRSATRPTYTPTAPDRGARLVVTVTATSPSGSSTALSRPTARVS